MADCPTTDNFPVPEILQKQENDGATFILNALYSAIKKHDKVNSTQWVPQAISEAMRVAGEEIDRLREAIRRLADQDATLSVSEGNVTVTMDATRTDAEPAAWSLFLDGKRARVIYEKEDALRFVGREPKYTLAPLYDYPPQPTLTDAEREAISGVLTGQNHLVIHEVWSEEWRKNCDTLRGLLERTK